MKTIVLPTNELANDDIKLREMLRTLNDLQHEIKILNHDKKYDLGVCLLDAMKQINEMIADIEKDAEFID